MNEQFGAIIGSMQRSAERAYKGGIQTGNGGNLSVRVPGTQTMLIKAKGGSFANLGEGNIVHTDFDGKVLAGSSEPSREFRSHALIYRICPDAGAVFHSHSPWSIACAARLERLPLVSMHMEMKLGGIPVMLSNGHADARMVSELTSFLATNPGVRAFIQRRHGIFSISRDIEDAEMQAELVEECAQIALLELISLGRP
ncbi:MAG: class II aldolase/adducin family protein [Devosia sp.]|nr:class II aldolase/adducin family protein [Devosia sp.]